MKTAGWIAFASACAGATSAFHSTSMPLRHAVWGAPGSCSSWRPPQRQRLRMAAEMDAGAEDGGGGLRTMFSPPWACMAKCGACCYLAPQERDLRCLPSTAGWCIGVRHAAPRAARLLRTCCAARLRRDRVRSCLSEQERETYIGMAGDDGW
jgi:hypothetical protein